jgi:hypothetical protein
VFRHNHIAGLTMQTDFAGYRPQGIEENCERKFELFLATLPASHYCFAVCVRSQSTLDHIEAYIAALEFFGGAPEILVTDNLKAAVIARPRRSAAVINPVMMCAADYYNMRVEPTRVRRPKDKAAVEVAVKLVQRLLRLRLRRQPLLPLSDINRILAEIIEQLNQKKMRRGNESRRERFERLDRPALQPLPAERLQFMELPVNRRVQTDHHIPFSKSYYSVPHSLVGKWVSVRSSSALVEIRFDGHVVAIHRRSYQEGDYVTLDIHRPENHIAWINHDFDSWRNGLDDNIKALVDSALLLTHSERREKQRLIERIRCLTREYGKERLANASRLARSEDALSFKHVRNMLKNKIDLLGEPRANSSSPIRAKANVRGADYFARDFGRLGGAA